MYAYVRNNPLKYSDPTGMQSEDEVHQVKTEALQKADNNNGKNQSNNNDNNIPYLEIPKKIFQTENDNPNLTLEDFNNISEDIHNEFDIQKEESNPIFKVEFKTEAGISLSGKFKLLGFGAQGKLGVSSTITEAVYSDEGIETNLIFRDKEFDANLSSGYGVGAVGISVEKSLRTSDMNVNANIGPIERSESLDNGSTRVTVFDIGLTFIVGGSIKLSLHPDVFTNNSNKLVKNEKSKDNIMKSDNTRYFKNENIELDTNQIHLNKMDKQFINKFFGK